MTEEWRAIPGWEGFYEVSSLGRVRSLPRTLERKHPSGKFVLIDYPGRVMSCPAWKKVKNGKETAYRMVTLSRGGARLSIAVSILVCTAFYGPRRRSQHAAHWDGNSLNDRAENLRWASAKENAADKLRHGTVPFGSRSSRSKLTDEQVEALLGCDLSGAEAAAKFGISASQVHRIRNRQKRAKQTEGLVITPPRPQRHPKGSDHVNAKLKDDQVHKILASELSVQALAARYSISEATVRAIRKGKTWRHLRASSGLPAPRHRPTERTLSASEF